MILQGGRLNNWRVKVLITSPNRDNLKVLVNLLDKKLHQYIPVKTKALLFIRNTPKNSLQVKPRARL